MAGPKDKKLGPSPWHKAYYNIPPIVPKNETKVLKKSTIPQSGGSLIGKVSINLGKKSHCTRS